MHFKKKTIGSLAASAAAARSSAPRRCTTFLDPLSRRCCQHGRRRVSSLHTPSKHANTTKLATDCRELLSDPHLRLQMDAERVRGDWFWRTSALPFRCRFSMLLWAADKATEWNSDRLRNLDEGIMTYAAPHQLNRLLYLLKDAPSTTSEHGTEYI